MRVVVKTVLVALLAITAVLTFQAWWVPIEVREHAAAANASAGPFAAIEAAGFAEAQWWLTRVTAPVIFLLACVGLVKVRDFSVFMVAAAQGFKAASGQPSRHSWLLRGFLGLWMLLAVYHAGGAVVQRLRDWPSYRFDDGERSLPNISARNRQVVRYVKSVTSPDARILVLSDQKLFFLSYYLLPRRLYHPLHPDSEFVIPLAYGARPLAAYTRDDLPSEYLADLKPDYVLEYFENEAHIDPRRVAEDTRWLQFYGGGRTPTESPPFLVVLRPYTPKGIGLGDSRD